MLGLGMAHGAGGNSWSNYQAWTQDLWYQRSWGLGALAWVAGLSLVLEAVDLVVVVVAGCRKDASLLTLEARLPQ